MVFPMNTGYQQLDGAAAHGDSRTPAERIISTTRAPTRLLTRHPGGASGQGFEIHLRDGWTDESSGWWWWNGGELESFDGGGNGGG